MRIKESDELKELATLSGKKPNEISDIIVSELISKKIIEDDAENWGGCVFDAISEDATEAQTADCWQSIAERLNVYAKKVFAIVPDLVLMGTDDCPECGGEMEVIDGDYKCTGGDGYITPYEYTAIWEEKRCTHCGHTESDEPDFESRDY